MKKTDLTAPELYINRELSLLEFNRRVIAQARDKQTPLLERLKFLFIASANLDEFFEIRVAGLKEKQGTGTFKPGPDQLSASETLAAISAAAHDMVESIYHIFNKELLPALEKEAIRIIAPENGKPELRHWTKNLFMQEIMPILSPVSLDFAHPFPILVNKSLNFIVSLQGEDAFARDSGLAIVHAPRALPRAFKVPESFGYGGESFVFLTDIIKAYAIELFPGMKVTGCYQFRLTRNSDLFVEDESVEDLANALKRKLRSRHYGEVARLELDAKCPDSLAQILLEKHHLLPSDLYRCEGPVNLNRYIVLLDMLRFKKLRYQPYIQQIPSSLGSKKNIFHAMQQQDILLHHPFQSFSPVLEVIRQATNDPDVLAIKQTLYRTGPESPVAKALIEAARAGKEVTVVIEIRARFDEESNITLANHLLKAGALVVYGVIGFKTHAKMTLIVRRENNKLVRYAHLGTGNYHENTSKLYTDLGFLTHRKDITNDVQKVFQLLTGMGKPQKLEKLLHSPFTLHKSLLALIDFETEQANNGKKSKIILKVNGLTERTIIQALYKASQAGVKIDLIVRGICCLRPGIKGVSENIKVRSIIGRFLEHSRVYYFYHAGDEKLFCSSADLMDRNLYYRVEVCFPIEDPVLTKRIKSEVLKNYLDDTEQAWVLKSSGQYEKLKRTKRVNAQQNLITRYSS